MLPPFVIGLRQHRRGGLAEVRDGGDQGDQLALAVLIPVRDLVFDDPDVPAGVLIEVTAAPGILDQGLSPLPGDLGIDQHRPVRAVGQQFQHRQQQVRLDPPQQRRPGISGRAPVLPAIEVPVGDQQPALIHPRIQRPGQRLLPAALRRRRSHRGQHRRVRAALADRHHPDLRERRPIIPAGARRAEGGAVLTGVRDIPFHPVHRHQPPRPQERPDRIQVRDRHRDL